MRLSFTGLLLLFAAALLAQPKQNSPYSQYGIGDLLPQYFANQAAWGGQTTASHDPFHINLMNPASFASLRTTTLDVGLFAKNSAYKSSSGSLNAWGGNLAYLSLGFTLKSPINEVLDRKQSPWQFGMGFTLTPYSQVGYNVQTRDTLPQLGEVTNSFEGSGGTYRLNWSNAVRYKNTSFGLNLGWHFGEAKYESRADFRDSFPTYSDVFRDEVAIKGLVWNVGIQHDFVLKHADEDKTVPLRWVTIGATAEGNHDLNASTNILRFRARPATGGYTGYDTLLNLVNDNRTITLPSAFSVGIQYVNASKFKAGLQFGLENWSNYVNEARPPAQPFRNTISLSGGVEYIPDFASYNRYLKRVRYRVGAYYRQDPRQVNGQDLNDIGFSFGFGLPLVLPRQQTSFINTAFEVGKLGADSPIEETYYRITVGFTLNDNTWFYKRRFE
ncbi:MAG TPA: hypothetical protein PKL15_15105 [Saprospiraceae bacterium]|nr:hypothetical protein [Saprospiraceae bacterium]HNM26767.1 hypothetical protein [Saprospiraceae bacterium]